MKKRLYEYSNRATLRSLLIGLGHARKEEKLYVVANVVNIIHHRFGRFDIQLTNHERRRLITMLYAARHGKPPLPEWIPRGYQVARLLMLTMIHAPGKTRVSSRDIITICTAEGELVRDKKKWVSGQLRSLRLTCRSIGLEYPY